MLAFENQGDEANGGDLECRPGDCGSILLVSPWFRPAVGGVTEVADRILTGIKRKGVPIDVLVLDGMSSLRIRCHPSIRHVWLTQIPFAFFNDPGVRSFASLVIKGPVMLLELMRFIRSHEITTILVLYPYAFVWPFLLVRRLLGTRLLLSLHGNDVTKIDQVSPASQWVLRQALRRADQIIVCAEHLEVKAKEIAEGCTAPISLIPNCVDSKHFFKAPEGYRRTLPFPTFVHISNFNPKKRTTDIIEAFAQATLPAASHLVMVGDGVDRETCQLLASRLALDGRIHFVGTQSDIRPFLLNADIFVLASDDEGAPLVLLEAMSCGLPWISTAWGAAVTLPPGECGIVVPARRPDRLAAAMSELAVNPSRCREMGHHARLRAVSDYGEEEYLERHLKLFRSVMQGVKFHAH